MFGARSFPLASEAGKQGRVWDSAGHGSDEHRVSLKFLVTGGAGFIGSHLVDGLLADGHVVRVIDDLSTGRRDNLDERAELVVGDVADPAVVANAIEGVGGVFHLAAVASVARANEDWLGTHRINQSATVAVLDAARAAGRLPVVYASSAAIYGDTGGAVAHEGLEPNPSTAYGADKFGSELHARVGSRIHGVPTLGLRFFNVYGPRQDPFSPYSGVISIFARCLTEGAAIPLHGDGGQTRDFVHVADVVAHLRAAMDRLMADPSVGGAALNVCTGRAVSIRQLALLLAGVHGVAPQMVSRAARPGDIRDSRGSPERAIAMLGVRAGVLLEQGLATVTSKLPKPASR
jgi:UDP-glucose 4-epimerase